MKRTGVAIALLIGTIVLSSACGEQSVGKPKLILVLSIDQMRFDYLTRFDDLYKGGFRALLDQGAIFSNANFRYAKTWTGPGHSVILSGRHPRHSGIVANHWYDLSSRRVQKPPV